MRTIASLVLIVLTTIATAVAYSYPQNVADWRGVNLNVLIENWGTPDIKIIYPNGHIVLIYHIQTNPVYNTQWSPAVGVNAGRGGTPLITVTPSANPSLNPVISALTCTVKFEVDKRQTIMSTQMEGNGCDEGRIHP
jgi:hypothetical protein